MSTNYKPILPSSLLDIQNSQSTGIFKHSFNNFSFKSGAITECYEIDDPQNISKLTPEYDVTVIEQDEDRGVTTTTYKNCITLDGVGGVGDFFEKKLRTPSKKTFKNDMNAKNQDACMVTLLCLDGVSDKGIIVGGLIHSARKTKLTKAKGYHLEGEFNGLNYSIDKDGALMITFKSASNNDGTYKNAIAGGSFIKIDKTGSIELSDGRGEIIKLDKTINNVDIASTKQINVKSGDNTTIASNKGININAVSDLIIEASGKCNLDIAKDISIQTKTKCKIQAQAIDITSNSSIKLSGKSVTIAAPSTTITAPALTITSATLGVSDSGVELGGSGGDGAVTKDTVFQGVLLSGEVVTCTAVGPFSSTVKIKS